MRSRFSRLKHLISCVTVVLAMATAARVAYADANTEKARQLYDDGVTNYNLGHYGEALAAFEKAYRVRHDAAFLFNIAQCQRQLRRYDDAQRSYRAYLRETSDLPQATRDQVQKLIGEMDQAMADARANQASAGTPPRAEVPAPPAIQQPPAAIPAVAMSVRPSDERAGRTKMIAGIAIAAFGIAAIGAGGGFFAVASSANNQLNHPSNGVYSQSAEDGRDTYQSLDIAAFIVGGVAVATGAAVALFGWRQRHRMTITPAASVNRIGASLNFNF